MVVDNHLASEARINKGIHPCYNSSKALKYIRLVNLSLYSHLTVTAVNIAAVGSGNNFYYLPDIATAILTFNTWARLPFLK
jgi:hypothetical protein